MIPGGVNPMLLSAGGSGYQLQRSLRLRASAGAYLSRTPAANEISPRATISFWMKRGALSAATLMSSSNGTVYDGLRFVSDKLDYITTATNDTFAYGAQTGAVFRDPSAWYHVVIAEDTSLPTASDRLKFFVNGVQVAATATNSGYPVLNSNSGFGRAWSHQVGAFGATQFLDGYMAEVHLVMGQALTPSAFGQFDANGMWQPKAYAGTYGTNGFRLDFGDPSSLTTLMADRSGNGNNWTANNVSLTAGATYDSMVDTPTNSYEVLNTLDHSGCVFSDGNLQVSVGAASTYLACATFPQGSGKWYWEVQPTLITANAFLVGIADYSGSLTNRLGQNAGGWYYLNNATKYNNGSNPAYGATFTTSDTIGIALDVDAGTLEFFKNGTSQGVAYNSGLTGKLLGPAIQNATASGAQNATFNFGQRPFAYTPPAGFKALHTGNLPDPSILNPKEHHNVYTVTKSGNTNFTLDWDATVYDTLFIIKRVDSTGSWYLVDGLRGYDKVLYCPSTSAENTDANVIGVSGTTCTLKSTLADGNYVIEAHKAGLSAARSTNTSGTITSTVSANLISGFSMVTYTGTAVNATVGHGQGTATHYGIVRNRSSSVDNWNVYHAAMTSPAYRLRLNTTDPEDSVPSMWNSTAPTSSVFSVGTQTGSNGSASPMLAYWWSARPGYSAFTSYTGNASADGPYMHLGFKARGVDTKGITVTSDWLRLDAVRSPSNPVSARLIRNTTDAESSGTHLQDFTANGDKIRNSSATGNNSGSRYLINAFAEATFKYALAR